MPEPSTVTATVWRSPSSYRVLVMTLIRTAPFSRTENWRAPPLRFSVMLEEGAVGSEALSSVIASL